MLISNNIAAAGSLPTKGYIEAPKQNESLQGTSEVRGWYVSGSDVKKIEVYVDGKNRGSTSYGLSRPDVQRVYPEYKNGNAGYKYNLNTKVLTTGKHTLTIKETSANGETQTQSRTFTVKNLAAKGYIEAPKQNERSQGTREVRGWYVNGSDVKKIEVYVDGKYRGSASYGLSRPDVQRVYPEYKNGNAGYKYNLNTKVLTTGKHTLTIKETSANGETQTQSRTFTVKNLVAKGYIEAPKQNESLQGTSEIRGWYVSGSGIKKIEVFVDDTYKGLANIGLARPDVKNAFPQYNENNSGFQYYLQTSGLSAGRHRLNLKATSLNGETQTTSRTIYVSKLPGGALKKGIDISHHQNDRGKIDFNAVRKSGISFVIVKASEGINVKDSKFEDNIINARKAGLETHAYHFFHSTGNDSDAKKEAALFASQLKKVNFKGYAFIDVEINGSVGKTNVTNRINIFLKELKNRGISKIGVYSYKNYFNNRIDLDKLKKNNLELMVWGAAYHDIDLGPQFSTDLWQYSSSGYVLGIVGSVDLDLAYNFCF